MEMQTKTSKTRTRTTLRNLLNIKSNSSPSSTHKNSFQKRILKLLVCGCANDQMGTLKIPETVPPAYQDAQRLKKAFQGGNFFTDLGWGTDEKAVIRVLGHRNASQRKEIRDAYQQLCNQSLIDGLTSELSGDFGRVVILWTYDPAERDARLANKALKTRWKGMKELQVIVEIACASKPSHLMAVRQAYCSLFDCSLEEEIIASVPIPLRKLLVGLVSSYRYDKQVVEIEVAKSEAARLHELVHMRKLDDDELWLILTMRNFFHLKATFHYYQENFGKSIEEDIASSGTGDIQALLKLVVLCIAYPEKHFAEVIRASVVGLGTDEDSLTRAIVTRAEVDMARIKEVYLEVNKESVENAVIGDTSGYYKDFLLTLLGQSFD